MSFSDSLDAQRIRDALPAQVHARIGRLEVVDEVVSTNDILTVEMTEAHDWVQIARRQTGARGRQGRRWEMVEGSGLCFSLLHHWKGVPPAGLTLWVGIALVKCLREMGLGQPCLAWPNDLILDSAKFGGILTECLSAEERVRCVIGVGINVEKAPKLDRPIASLFQVGGQNIEPNQLAAACVEALSICVAWLEGGELALLGEAFARYDGLEGREVEVVGPEQSYIGYARGVDEAGRLRVEGADGMRCFDSADVRLCQS